MRWAGHVTSMRMRNTYEILVGIYFISQFVSNAFLWDMEGTD
jgi:hypothetical protein